MTKEKLTQVWAFRFNINTPKIVMKYENKDDGFYYSIDNSDVVFQKGNAKDFFKEYINSKGCTQ